jgi:DNA-binding NarL/FixJ family response regulator
MLGCREHFIDFRTKNSTQQEQGVLQRGNIVKQDTSRPTVLLVAGEVLVRLNMAAALESAGMHVVPVVNAEEALQVLPNLPDLKAVVIDAKLPLSGTSDFELARTIRNERHVSVVIVSDQAATELDDLPSGVYFIAKPFHRATLVQLVQNAVQNARAFYNRSMPVAEQTEQKQHEAMPHQELTRRQHEILEMLVQGKSNRDIAAVLGLSENTVKVHVGSIFQKLGVHSRTEALLAGLRILQLH